MILERNKIHSLDEPDSVFSGPSSCLAPVGSKLERTMLSLRVYLDPRVAVPFRSVGYLYGGLHCANRSFQKFSRFRNMCVWHTHMHVGCQACLFRGSPTCRGGFSRKGTATQLRRLQPARVQKGVGAFLTPLPPFAEPSTNFENPVSGPLIAVMG